LRHSGLPCPACDKGLTRNLGPLRPMPGAFNLPAPGDLYACDSCGLFFRNPYISEADLKEVYSTFSSHIWSDTVARPDFDLAADVIRVSMSSGSLLDVGCYEGNFLKRFPDTFLKYGIELSEQARKIARQCGIDLVGTSIDGVEIDRPMFHAITLLDVFEHLPRPMDSLKKIVDLLVPGGIIIIATGNTDAFLWRMMRRDYWYYFPEHVSFANHQWFSWAAGKLHLDIAMVKKFSHMKGPLLKKWRQIAHCLAYCGLERVRPYSWVYKMAGVIYPFNRTKKWTSAPLANLLPDHMMVVLKSRTG
jgi:2-polyprenyl-3-methyl-5-hydroxy-6-metoxy-1,4-benzoquinol methylase